MKILSQFVEGCKPSCFECGKIGHVRVVWKPPRDECEEELEEEKENEINNERK